jgi:hypothetical protein
MRKMKMRKHLLLAVVALCLAVGLTSTFIVRAQDTVTVSISAPDEVAEGTDFTAKVNINQVTNFDATDYAVTFDPTVLQVENVTNGLIAGTTIPVDAWGVITPGTTRVIQNVPGFPGVSGSGYLAEIHFHVIGSAGKTSDIDLE